jgi:hypothetical protein
MGQEEHRRASSGNGQPARRKRSAAQKGAVAEPFPYRYKPQRALTIEVREGFGGAVVLMPSNLNSEGKLDHRIELFVSADAGSARFTPAGLGMMVINVPFGFELSSEALTPIMQATYESRGGRPPGPGIVKGH